jgi:voltage-gated potassium channel
MSYHHTKRLLLVRKGLLYSLALALIILLFGGVGFWAIDPRIETLSDGLWLAFTTAATVGYGDLIPHTPLSRLFSVVVVLLGLAVLSLVTASLSAIFVEQEVHEEEVAIKHNMALEMHQLRQEVRALREQIARQVPPEAGQDQSTRQ